MLKRIKIDALLVFLVLALAFLWLGFPQVRTSLLGNQHYRVVVVPAENQLAIPQQGNEAQEANIHLYNPSLSLYYSVDGGQHYQKADNGQIAIDAIKNPQILYRNTSIRWRHPKGNFPALKTVMVKVKDERKHIENKPKALTYFSGDVGPFPVVSIQLKEDELLGTEKGLMVYGQAAWEDDGFQKDWWYRSANFANRGTQWGRNVAFQYFESGELKADQLCEMRISGNATRYFPQKSVKLFPLAGNGKRTKMKYAFWGDEGNKKMKSLLLRNSGNDNNKTMFADLMMQTLAKETHVLTQCGKPVSVFFNGNYWGIYNLRERVDKYYIAKKEDVDDKKVTILFCEVYGDRTLLKSGSKKEKEAFDEIIHQLPEGPMTDQQYDSLKEEISMKSFIDYILLESFYANKDWLHNNVTWYKADDKKWKWLLNDLDYSLAYPGEENLNVNLFDKLKSNDAITAQLFNALITNETFKKKIKKRARKLMDEHFSDERIEETYTAFKTMYSQGIEQQINRWRFIPSVEQWEVDCEKNVTFLRNRRTLFLEQVESL